MSGRSFTRTSALLWLALCPLVRAAEPEVTVAAAASLKAVVGEVVERYREQPGKPAVIGSFGASGDLLKQAEGGAPIDVVLFANAQMVDQLIERGHALADSRRVFAVNQLVLVGPKGAPPLGFRTIEKLPAEERLAIGNPGSVPAGQYAREAFQKLGKWDLLQGRMIFGGDVAAVLAYARRGEVGAAVVYSTDVRGLQDVVVLDEAKGDWAPEVQYVAALVSGGPNPAGGRDFLDFLVAPRAQDVFAKFGFRSPSNGLAQLPAEPRR